MFCLGKMKGLSSSSYMYNVIDIFPKIEVEVSDRVFLFYRKLLRHDRRSEPRTGERVPYVIIYGSPGLPLIQLVRQPGEVLSDPALRLNATYYITKQILPPLDRVFSLLGVDVFSWWEKSVSICPKIWKLFYWKLVQIFSTWQILTTIRKHTLLGFNISILYKYGNKILYNFCMIFQILELKERDSLTGVVWFYFHCFCLCLSLANLLSLSLSSMVMLVLVLWTPGTTTCPRWSGSSHSPWWPLTSGKELYLNTSQPLTVQYVINRPISRSVTAVSRTHSLFVSLSVIGSGDGRRFIMTWCR